MELSPVSQPSYDLEFELENELDNLYSGSPIGY
jgi:hypothetical protein